MNKKTYSEEIQKMLKSVADHFDDEDRSVRERQIRTWRQLKLYWNSISNVWYSDAAHDWRIFEAENESNDADAAYYDKPVNVFRAYLESIIAALSVSVPAIKCTPDDADEPLDLQTAKAGDRIAELVSKHNDVMLLWLHALYIYCTEGMVACYSYPRENKDYGSYDVKKYKDEVQEAYLCPNCGNRIEDELIRALKLQQMPDPNLLQQFPSDPDFTNDQLDAFQVGDIDADLQNLVINEEEVLCSACGEALKPDLEKSKFTVTKMVGIDSRAKTRQCMEVYGGLNVKIPNYAMKQEDIPYLRFSYETHYSNIIERYPDLYDKVRGQSTKATPNTGVEDPYEAWGRLSPQYYGEFPINNVTCNNYWFRPSAFNVLKEEESKALKKEFPNGCKYVKVNECFAEACNEALDDCWTLTHNPLADHIQHDPLGLLLVSVQDMTQEIVSLVLQTIEHGISQTFVAPETLDLKAYSQLEARPGDLVSTKAMTGKSIGDGFYQISAATLSGEILPFFQKIQEMGQLVSGATPSLFGGQVGGSRTASEYSMSRAQALQRLQTPWKMLTAWWRQIYGKVIPQYIKTIKEQNQDEKFTKKDRYGNFVNVFIRRSELDGRLGNIELEASEQLPTMWAQQKDIIMQLLQAGHPLIMETIGSPENLPYVAQALGLSQFRIPGEDDREKQYEEIKQLLNSTPIPNPDFNPAMPIPPGMPPPPPEIPSVEVDVLVDNHMVEAEICKIWAVSDAGRLAKLENLEGYKNVLLHMQMHMMAQAQTTPPPMPNAAGQKPPNEEKPPKTAAQKGAVNEPAA